MSANYLNLYLFAIFGSLVATVGGILICYSGISETSYLVYQGSGINAYYLDKFRYDLYLNGLVYSLTFCIAFLLFIAVILIPSPEQIKKRQQSEVPSGVENVGTTDVSKNLENEMPTDTSIPEHEDNALEIELEPEIENFDIEEDENTEISLASSEDSDVVYGTGSITDLAHRSFILSNPDSAVKFLLRKELDGRPLKSSQDEIYEGWQKRGLSRGKLRKHFLKIMEWDSVPELEVIEIFNKLKDKVYEIKHSENN